MKKQNKKQGFTLVELLVVIAILAILATVSIVGYTAFIDRAHKSNAMAEANQIKEAISVELISGNEIVIGTVTTEATAETLATSTTYTLKRGTDTMVITVETVNVAADKTTTPVKKSTHTIALNGTAYTVTDATWNWETDKYVAGTAETLSIPTTLTVSQEVKTLVELDGALVFEFDSSKNVLSLVYTYDVDGEKDIQVRIDLNDLETVEIVDEK